MNPPAAAAYAIGPAQPFAAVGDRHIAPVALSEILAAMSYALDLTEGQTPGHTVRTTIIGMRLADELGMSAFDNLALYGSLLLKDAGSSGRSRVSELLDAHQPEPGPPPRVSLFSAGASKVRKLGESALQSSLSSLQLRSKSKHPPLPLVMSRAERGEKLALGMGFSTATAEAVRHIDEHWDGTGVPDGRMGYEIPMASRIILLAQTMDGFFTQRGLGQAMRVARERSGFWFDPALVRIVRSWREDVDWWESLKDADAAQRAVALEPQQHVRLVDEKGLDDVSRSFAEIIDSKSSFTYQHSTNVAKYARATAYELGFEKREVAVLNRAALLHDVGKLGIPSAILEKAGPMTDAERAEMQRHPLYTWEVLQRVSAFNEFARTAALHHEKLDGSGYPWGVKGDDMEIPSRILCVADMYEALTANRPYRVGLSRETALGIIRKDSGTKLCSMATEALTEATRHLRVAIAS